MPQTKQPATYILANKKNGTIYTGVTSNLIQRTHQHKTRLCKGFSEKYGCKILVYFQQFDEMAEAIAYEKKLKAGSRQAKVKLIEQENPEWLDLYDSIL